jgi:hypothetical protein
MNYQWLLLTFVLEIPVLYLFYYKTVKFREILFIGILLSCITWPIAMYLCGIYPINIFLLEIIIGLTEGLIIYFCQWGTYKKAALAGIVMNAFSFLAGELIKYFLGIEGSI